MDHPANRMPPNAPTSWDSLVKLVLAVSAVAAVAMLGQWATLRSINDWYVDLVKPAFTPPNAVFPLAWSFLYALLAMSLWRLLRLPAHVAGRRLALLWFAVQMALNGLWSWAFFGYRNPWAGLVVIIALIAASTMAARSAYRVDRPAGVAFLPYVAWLLFAAALNAAIVWLN
jgi:translocator protein